MSYDRGAWIAAVRERVNERSSSKHPEHIPADDRRSIMLTAFLRAEHADWKTGEGSRLSKRGAYLAAGLRPEHIDVGDGFLLSEDLSKLAGRTRKNVEEFDLSIPDRDALSRGGESFPTQKEDEQKDPTATLSVAHRDALSRGTATLSGHNLPKPPRNVRGGDRDDPPGSAVRTSPVGFIRELSRRVDHDDIDPHHRELRKAAVEALAAGIVPDDVDLRRFEPTTSAAGLLATRIRRATETRPRPVAERSRTTDGPSDVDRLIGRLSPRITPDNVELVIYQLVGMVDDDKSPRVALLRSPKKTLVELTGRINRPADRLKAALEQIDPSPVRALPRVSVFGDVEAQLAALERRRSLL